MDGWYAGKPIALIHGKRPSGTLPPVSSRVTLQDVADRAGSSRTTAHYVLTGQDREMRIAEETRRRVLRAANELRYRPNLMARGLRTQVTRTIALITDTVATEAYAGGLVYGAVGDVLEGHPAGHDPQCARSAVPGASPEGVCRVGNGWVDTGSGKPFDAAESVQPVM